MNYVHVLIPMFARKVRAHDGGRYRPVSVVSEGQGAVVLEIDGGIVIDIEGLICYGG